MSIATLLTLQDFTPQPPRNRHAQYRDAVSLLENFVFCQ
ncbi:hypothetical protein EMGBD1_03950 [Anaerolineaceae bacterium]|nr:hypothetical protein EMGBD1_03950 [Anaerolineaceae bacterium]